MAQRAGSEVEDGECADSPQPIEDDSEDVVVLEEAEFAFTLDRSPNEDILTNITSAAEQNSLSLFSSSLLTLNDKCLEGDSNDNKKRFKATCFNCGGEHNLQKCTEPRNYERIRQNREVFMDKPSRPDGRYHAEDSIKAGRLSESLQEALGVGPNDIPEYIYRMRKMGFYKGYPPGYLKIALGQREDPNQLLVFHSTSSDLQEGEEVQPKRAPSPVLDSKKLIYYCGFNMTYKKLRDRERFIVPPFDEFVRYVEREYRMDADGIGKGPRNERKRKAQQDESADTKKTKKDDALVSTEKVVGEECSVSPSGSSSTTNGAATDKVEPGGIKLGTPVLLRRGEVHARTPSLEAFAKDIVPFEVDEPTPRTGFLEKIMKKIRNVIK